MSNEDRFAAAQQQANALMQQLMHPTKKSTGKPLSVAGKSILQVYHDFTNNQTHPGYKLEYGQQEPSVEGWRFHSSANGDGVDGSSARFYYDFLFNDANPCTFIQARMRGAPDAGKNSNVYLIEPHVNGKQNGSVDEVDIVEVYGAWNKAEWCVYRKGPSHKNGPGKYKVSNPGWNAYTYRIFLVKGSYLSFTCLGPDNQVLGEPKEFFGGDVPQNPMRLYSGIWAQDQKTPPFQGNAYMCLYSLLMLSW